MPTDARGCDATATTPRVRALVRRIAATAVGLTAAAAVLLGSAAGASASPSESTYAGTAGLTGGDCRVSTTYRAAPTTGGTQLYAEHTEDGVRASAAVGDAAGVPYRGLALDPTSGILFGTADVEVDAATVADAGGRAIGRGDLLAIDRDTGSVTALGRPDGMPAEPFDAATASPDGVLYLLGGDRSDAFTEVHPASGTVVTHVVTGGGQLLDGDVAWAAGYLWTTDDAGDRVQRLNPSTGSLATFPAPASLDGASAAGGMFAYGNGNLGLVADDGTTTQVDVGDPAYPTFTRIATYPASTESRAATDAAACIGDPTSLALTVSAPASVAPSDTVTWTANVHNAGDTGSAGWVLRDTLPAGYTDIRVPEVCTADGTSITCSADHLEPGATTTVSYSATAPSTAQCSYTSPELIGDEEELDDADNRAQVTTCVDAVPGLRLVQTSTHDDEGTITPGESMTYSVEVANTGNEALTGVTVTSSIDDVLDDADLVESSVGVTSGAAPVLSDRTLTWTGDLHVAESVVVSYRVRVHGDATDGDDLVTGVTATSAQSGSNCRTGAEAGCRSAIEVVDPAAASPTGTATPTASGTPTATPTGTPTASPSTAATAVSAPVVPTPAGDGAVARDVGNGPDDADGTGADTTEAASTLADTGGEPSSRWALPSTVLLLCAGLLVAHRRRA